MITQLGKSASIPKFGGDTRMNSTIRIPIILGRCVAMASLTLLPGCSTSISSQGGIMRANADTVAKIQVCVPTKRIYFTELQLDRLENHPNFTRYSKQQLELAPKTIRRVAPRDDPRVINDPRVVKGYGLAGEMILNTSGLYSAGTAFMSVKDSTTSHQPVYEMGHEYPASNYVAISVRLVNADVEQGVKAPTYWFKLPANISADGFSGWFPPHSMEKDPSSTSFWYRLTQRGDLPIHPVDVDPPKMRIKLLKSRPAHNDPTIDSLPALTTARLTLKTATGGPDFVYEFVAKTNEVIPSCD